MIKKGNPHLGRRILLSTGLLSLLLGGCTSFKINTDISGLEKMAAAMVKEVGSCDKKDLSGLPSMREFLDALPKSATVSFLSRGEPRWEIRKAGGNKILSSEISLPKGLYPGDRLIFSFYEPENWDREKAILWVPGYGVSDMAYIFIRKFIYEELKQGYAVLFYNLPYHLDRIEPGKKQGEGLITADLASNVKVFYSMVEELNHGYNYLKELGVKDIGGWAGSIGAAALNILSSQREFGHMALMIPILDWNTLIFRPEFSEVVEKLTSSTCTTGEIRDAYSQISPVSHPSLTRPEKILIQAGEYDQLTPSSRVLEYAKSREISNTLIYRESHATILLNSKVFRDYAAFLENVKTR